MPGGSAQVVDGTTISIAAGGSVAVINGQTSSIALATGAANAGPTSGIAVKLWASGIVIGFLFMVTRY